MQIGEWYGDGFGGFGNGDGDGRVPEPGVDWSVSKEADSVGMGECGDALGGGCSQLDEEHVLNSHELLTNLMLPAYIRGAE
jgi:hypothetical protein